MAKEVPSTVAHKSPVRPQSDKRRPALVCAFPRPLAVAIPDSGSVVGRAWLADHQLADTEVSGKHLRFDRAGGVVRVADVGSRNGSWLNGTRLAEDELAPLDDGALLRIGCTLLVARHQLTGPFEPAPPIGQLVGPFGLRAVAHAIDGLAASGPSNVLIEGETGVGKELTARAIAAAIGRAEPYAAINVAGVAAGVFESQFFGHVAGAFSGAGAAAPGVVVAHDGGTLFLDEIGELSLDLQAKLLRLLDNREVLPVGASKPRSVDVVVLAATNRDLEGMVEAGAFRRDLLARLSMARIQLPPLRERREDIFSVACALAQRAGAPLEVADVEVEAVERLSLAPWPTNVRGLDATLAAARRHDREPGLRLWALEEELGAAPGPQQALTQRTVDDAIERAGGNLTAAAELLGVSRGRLLRFRKKKG
jgi:transcriptional regulator with GAF, ATPase, and Fis domain